VPRAFAILAPQTPQHALLATAPAPRDRVSPDERRRADPVREGPMPTSREPDASASDGCRARAPMKAALENIAVPTRVLSREGDPFAPAETARLSAARIPAARLAGYPGGGRIRLGHDAGPRLDAREAIIGTSRPELFPEKPDVLEPCQT
jgi:pimeloyl-ACP methyl ester carboxylesterase